MLSKYTWDNVVHHGTTLLVQCWPRVHSDLLSQEYKHYSVVLIYLDQYYTRKLPDSPQTTLVYNFVWIYLGQHCTRKNSLCNIGPCLTANVHEENDLYSVVPTMLGKHCVRILSTRLSKYMWDNIAQNYLCNVSPECTGIFLQETPTFKAY